ncbi:hypothetical protein [Leifsonia xyli]|uniref:hypothetical protein n=2 Tax=Leifsonia xyli TaxID=1575 RepID=UPI00114CBF10|nr:hypothetical protein [Leifsonia xyli]
MQTSNMAKGPAVADPQNAAQLRRTPVCETIPGAAVPARLPEENGTHRWGALLAAGAEAGRDV